MKYHTLSTSSLNSEGKKSTLTIYTGPEFIHDKMGSTETAIVRCELEMAQRALKLQTRRCRQLVSEYTRKLQAKELEIISERRLRDEQLTKVLRSLLVFEARLKQEQIFIRHQLEEKDDLIQQQKKELRGLHATLQYCKTCSQFYYNNYSNCIDSCDSSSEYCITTNHDIWESGSELGRPHSSGDDFVYEKNSYKRMKKSSHRRAPGTYFNDLKSRESSAESSPEDAASDLSDTLKTKEQIVEEVSERIEELFTENTYSEKMDSLHGIKKPNVEIELEEQVVSSESEDVIENSNKKNEVNHINDNLTNEEKELLQVEINTSKNRNISETIPLFDAGEGEQNDWYASASDQEDDDQRDIYRNNPVLECMNQILLQNINDSINSPPKSPELDHRNNSNSKSKTQKRVKFSDESNVEKEAIKVVSSEADYYETPIQGAANFYEVPQSIYSNDYEQILSKCSGDSVHNWSPVKSTSPTSKLENLQENKINRMSMQKLTVPKCNSLNELETKNHYYIDMETTYPTQQLEIVKKTKVARTPPALPPKPANLVSKSKMLNKSPDNLEDSEPDYCSISELNLPPEKTIISSKPNPPETSPNILLYDPISLNGTLSTLIKTPNFQAPKQAQPSPERITANIANISQINMLKNKTEPEIPKLPQVSEIIIPEETEPPKKEDRISQDNYIKNNSILLKQKSTNKNEKFRNRILIGTSVSNLISNFNNQYNLSQTTNKKINPEKLFSSFEYSQNYDKQQQKSPETPPSFDKFDLSQNFEEFNLDDCEIGEEYQSESSNYEDKQAELQKEEHTFRVAKTIQQLQKTLSAQQLNKIINRNSEPSYEHFLECTGLSSKSILTPSRMLSNHKSMLKPKDIKLRSRAKSTAVFEDSSGTVKYWSEPYL